MTTYPGSARGPTKLVLYQLVKTVEELCSITCDQLFGPRSLVFGLGSYMVRLKSGPPLANDCLLLQLSIDLAATAFNVFCYVVVPN